MWDIHPVEPHTAPPGNLGLAPNYGLVGSLLSMAQAKDICNNENNNFKEDAITNRALTKLFLSLLSPKHNQAHYNLLAQDPGQRVG